LFFVRLPVTKLTEKYDRFFRSVFFCKNSRFSGIFVSLIPDRKKRSYFSVSFIVFSLIFQGFAVQPAPAAQAVNVQYIHDYIQQKHGITVPINASNPLQIANVKYLLCAVDRGNEIYTGGMATTDYCNHTLATQQVVDTVATIDAVNRLIKDTNCYRAGYYNASGTCTICTKDYYCPIGVTGRTPCGDGYVTSGTGATSAASCYANFQELFFNFSFGSPCVVNSVQISFNFPSSGMTAFRYGGVDWGDGSFENFSYFRGSLSHSNFFNGASVGGFAVRVRMNLGCSNPLPSGTVVNFAEAYCTNGTRVEANFGNPPWALFCM
jgi:hypothetical protein